MPKPRLSFKARIPPYIPNKRNEWRKKLHLNIKLAVEQRKIHCPIMEHLKLEVILYLKGIDLEMHDIDNRLKDIMDAPQGRAGGTKGKTKLKKIIKNDRQIYKVTIEKMKPPKQSLGQGHIVIRKCRL